MAADHSLPVTSASSGMLPSVPPSAQGRRLRESLTSSHSILSQSSHASSMEAEKRAEVHRQLLAKQDEIRRGLAENLEEMKQRKADLQKVSTALILDSTRVLKKEANIQSAKEELERRRKITHELQHKLKIAKTALEEQQGITETAKEWVKTASEAVESDETTLKAARQRVEEQELITRQCNEAFLDADRIKDKELLRLRRIREISELDRVRANEVKRLVNPLQEPFTALQDQFAPLNYAASDAEERALAARERVALCSAREFETQKARDALLDALPKLRAERDQGYMKLGESKYMYDQAARFIVEHKYQEAFFKRTYKNTAPSPVDGMILEAVGNIKDRDYTDTWGEKGIGPPVVALKLQEIVHKIEQDAVAECERNLISFSRDYDIQHGELLHAQTANESLQRQAQRLRAQADETAVLIEAAEARLADAKHIADESRAKADESHAQMIEQNEITENAILVANRASDDWAQARVKADLEILFVEELEESYSRVCAIRGSAQEKMQIEQEQLVRLHAQTKYAQEAADSALAEENAARKALEVTTAEFEFQCAKQAKSNVKKQEMDGEVKATIRLASKLEEELRGLGRLSKYDQEQNVRHEALARCRIQQSQAQLQVIQMRKEIEAACAAGAPRGSIAERVLHGLEHHVAACGLQAIVGSWEEAQRARIGGKDCVKTPALGRNPNLCFSRMARVFEGHNSGATILRVSPSSRPSNIKGWVSQTTNVSTLKYSALTAQPMVSGRHSWSCVVEEFAGKGFLLVGIVRDPDAADAAPVTEQRVVGRCDATTVRRGTRFEAGCSQSFGLDLNSWCLGDCANSWALSSDGVKVHDSKVADFTGSNIEAGCSIKVLLDLTRNTLAFSLNGKQLGPEMHGIEGPVIPAISITRTATCRVTFCDYWRA